MNICFTICSLSNCGGTERVSTMIANELSARGYHVFFVSYAGQRKLFFPLNRQISVFRILRNRWEHKMRHIPGYVQWRYQRFLRKKAIDVVIDVDVLMAEISAIACSRVGCKLISWDHFNYNYMQGTKRKQNVLQLVERCASQLVVLTQADKKMYAENTDFNPDFITQIYNPISPIEQEVISHGKKKVLAVGRFSPIKGFDLLLRIWSMVEPQMPEWELEIVGDDGLDEAGLSPLKEELGLQRVTLLPATRQVAQFYRDASIYVLSSRSEGFPMVLLEATSMSLPIVAFDCQTGPNEIIEDGCNGFLISPGDLTMFAQKLMCLMQDENLRHKFGRRSFEISQKFSLSEICDQWQSLLTKVVQ